MENEEQIYDFMAAAEETGKQIDAMAKQLPKDMAAMLQQQWQQSPWRSELPAVAESTIEAAKSAEEAADTLWKTARMTFWMAGIASVAIPIVMCIVAYLNLANARRDEDAAKKRVQALEGRESSLRYATGGGAEFYQQDGVQYFVPPPEALNCEQWLLQDGRIGIKYTFAK